MGVVTPGRGWLLRRPAKSKASIPVVAEAADRSHRDPLLSAENIQLGTKFRLAKLSNRASRIYVKRLYRPGIMKKIRFDRGVAPLGKRPLYRG